MELVKRLNSKEYSANIKDYLHLFLKSPNCILYSQDGFSFKIRKELLSQTKFLREILSSEDNCCGTLEVICPCTEQELAHIVNFLYDGEIHYENYNDFCKIQDNLNKIFGFPRNLSLHDPNQALSEAQNDLLTQVINAMENDEVTVIENGLENFNLNEVLMDYRTSPLDNFENATESQSLNNRNRTSTEEQNNPVNTDLETVFISFPENTIKNNLSKKVILKSATLILEDSSESNTPTKNEAENIPDKRNAENTNVISQRISNSQSTLLPKPDKKGNISLDREMKDKKERKWAKEVIRSPFFNKASLQRHINKRNLIISPMKRFKFSETGAYLEHHKKSNSPIVANLVKNVLENVLVLVFN